VAAFVRSVLIDAPVAIVFAFHERADALEMLTPAFPPVRVVARTDGIGVGSRVELRIGAVIRWIALHTEYQKDRLFVDEQIEGPFAHWVHRHEFEPDGPGRTRLTDRVEFRLPGGTLVNSLLGWTVSLGLGRMFAHRHRITRRICEQS